MKNYIKTSIIASIALFAFSTPYNSFAGRDSTGWDYKSVESVDRMDGLTYIVSHCEDKIGDDCTHPGSATRTDISVLVDILTGMGILRPLE